MKVHLADVQVADSWHDVMSPPPAPAPGKKDSIVCAGSTTSSGLRTTSTTGERPDDEAGRAADRDDAVAAAKAGEMMRFEIEAGDGLTEADAADLTSILRKVRPEKTAGPVRVTG